MHTDCATVVLTTNGKSLMAEVSSTSESVVAMLTGAFAGQMSICCHGGGWGWDYVQDETEHHLKTMQGSVLWTVQEKHTDGGDALAHAMMATARAMPLANRGVEILALADFITEVASRIGTRYMVDSVQSGEDGPLWNVVHRASGESATPTHWADKSDACQERTIMERSYIRDTILG